MGTFIDTAINVIDKLLTIVNTKNKLIVLTVLFGLGGTGWLVSYLVKSPDVMDEFISPKIERVGSAMSGSAMCYQQRHKDRSGSKATRIIGIQFPVSDKLVQKGIEQNLAGFTINKEPSLAEFNEICELLVQEIASPERQRFLWNAYPDQRKKLLEFYQKLNTEENPPVLKLKGKVQPVPSETAANASIERG